MLQYLYMLKEHQLRPTPSEKDGIDWEIERQNTIFACNVINYVGIALKLPQVTIATAQITFHRFYYRESMKNFDPLYVSLACVFLATKIEETPRKIHEILKVFDRVCKKIYNLPCTHFPSTSTRYSQWYHGTKKTELAVLKELGFILYVEHPHKFILNYITFMRGSVELAQKSWCLLNDSMRTNLCLRFTPQVLATASIFLAARLLNIKLPDSPHWYLLFDVKYEQLMEISRTIMKLYTQEKIGYIPIDGVDLFNLEEDIKKADAANASLDNPPETPVSSATSPPPVTSPGQDENMSIISWSQPKTSGPSPKRPVAAPLPPPAPTAAAAATATSTTKVAARKDDGERAERRSSRSEKGHRSHRSRSRSRSDSRSRSRRRDHHHHHHRSSRYDRSRSRHDRSRSRSRSHRRSSRSNRSRNESRR